jgi:PAS domain-containing protein
MDLPDPNQGQRARELCEFLKFARSRVAPSHVGILATGRRRVAGLRRDEVAALCGVSVAWYTLFERGRPDIRASPRLIAAVARALRLDDRETTYLFSLAVPEMPRMESPVRGLIESTLESVIAAWPGMTAVPETLCEPFDLLPIGVYCTVPDGSILYANRALIGLLGYTSRATYLGLNVARDLYRLPRQRDVWKREIERAGSLRNVTATARHADGRDVAVRDSATVLRTRSGSIACYLGIWEPG